MTLIKISQPLFFECLKLCVLVITDVTCSNRSKEKAALLKMFKTTFVVGT